MATQMSIDITPVRMSSMRPVISSALSPISNVCQLNSRQQIIQQIMCRTGVVHNTSPPYILVTILSQICTIARNLNSHNVNFCSVQSCKQNKNVYIVPFVQLSVKCIQLWNKICKKFRLTIRQKQSITNLTAKVGYFEI